MDKYLLLQLLLPLLMAHLLADFVFQPDSLAKNKDKWLWRALHSFIHAILAYVLLAKWVLWFVPVTIGVTHFFIDWGKKAYIVKKRKKKEEKGRNLLAFTVDQGIHLLVLLGLTFLVYATNPTPPIWLNWLPPIIWDGSVLICAVILLLPCGGRLISLFMDPIQGQIESQKGLKEGGKLIGYLERLLILTFMITNQYAGIGFLVAAKSILRFNEIKNSDDRKEAEYIIIGTFASFLYAIIISWMATKAMK